MQRPHSSALVRVLVAGIAGLLWLAGPANAAQFNSISPGLNHTCAVKDADATLWCWGEGRQGQVGVIGVVRQRTPTYVIGSYQARQVSSGQAFFCQSLLDGTVTCSGRAERGQIGNGSTTPAQYAMEVSGLTGATKVAAGAATACAVHSGRVACWGDGIRGQLGNGAFMADPSPLPADVPGLADMTDVAVGEGHACATRRDGLAFCWGDTTDGKLGNERVSAITFADQPVVGLSNAQSIAVGDRHSCALRSGGTVACWGANGEGQLGNGSTAPSGRALTVPGLANVKQIAAAGMTTCVVKTDGTVWCWGDNTAGQIGNGTRSRALVPTQTSVLTDAAQVGVGSRHVCAVTRTQAPFCWGSNSAGQLGTGAPYSTSALTPQLVQDYVFGAATFIPASLDGTVPSGSTAGGALQFNSKALRRSGTRCPARASLRITARGETAVRRVEVRKQGGGCVTSGRYLLPRDSQNATKATYRFSGTGLRVTSETLRAFRP